MLCGGKGGVKLRIKVKLSAGATAEIEDVLVIDDGKIAELSEEELEAAIEIVIRDWADRMVRIEWEVEESGDPG